MKKLLFLIPILYLIYIGLYHFTEGFFSGNAVELSYPLSSLNDFKYCKYVERTSGYYEKTKSCYFKVIPKEGKLTKEHIIDFSQSYLEKNRNHFKECKMLYFNFFSQARTYEDFSSYYAEHYKIGAAFFSRDSLNADFNLNKITYINRDGWWKSVEIIEDPKILKELQNKHLIKSK